MKKTDSYTAMDDSIPKRPGQATDAKPGGDVLGVRKTSKKPRARRRAKKSPKKALR